MNSPFVRIAENIDHHSFANLLIIELVFHLGSHLYSDFRLF